MRLSKRELKKISIGYLWNPSMSYETFCHKNHLNPKGEKSYEVYQKIESRYLKHIDDVGV